MNLSITFSQHPLLAPPPSFPLSQESEIGAVVDFYGVVRGLESGSPIAGLDYDAYLGMADKELRRICIDLAQLHPCRSVTFQHRLGPVPVGEPSLHVRVEAKHRAAAFAFARELVDRMKEDVPIWKI